MNTYIHERVGWPEFVWDALALEPLIGAVRFRQGHLQGRMQGLGFADQAKTGMRFLEAEIVKSCAIEGEILDSEQVRSSIARQLGMETLGLKKASRHIDGIVEMMLDATRNHGRSLTADRLQRWQAALFPTGRSGMRDIVTGAWRTGPMRVVSGRMGREKVHFEAPTATRITGEMDAFITWCNQAPTLDPVLKAAVSHFWFVTIHPFDDGNGRIARAIGEMMLARADQSADRFYSMSSQIEAERNLYYDTLEASQKGGLDITRWLLWFMECLLRTIEQAEITVSDVLWKAHVWSRINEKQINNRQRTVLNRLIDGFKGKLNSSKYAKLAKCSSDTALRDINDLLEHGILLKNEAGGRSTSYRLSEEQCKSSKTAQKDT